LAIFVYLWSSEGKSDQENIWLGQFFGQKSTFGWLSNPVRQKWGHTSCQIPWIKNPRNSIIVYYKCCRVRRFQNFIHQFCVCQGFSWLQDLLLISRWWWWDGQKLRPSFRVGIISETHCSTYWSRVLTDKLFLGHYLEDVFIRGQI
jgi:hypothetical protein